MELATWNVNSLAVRLPQVLDWLQSNPVDVLALQELKLIDEKFPHEAFARLGYHSACFGQKTYNGVALIARTPLEETQRNLPSLADEQARVLTASVASPRGPIRMIGAYFPNGQAPDSEKFAYKLQWLQAMREHVASELKRFPQLALMGDFNITFDDRDVWDPDGLRETIHCTTQERTALAQITSLGLSDTFRLFEQPERSFSWWDYRMLGFQKNRGLRIDHILVSEPLRAQVRSCRIDRAPRKLKQPSDHAPVVVELLWD